MTALRTGQPRNLGSILEEVKKFSLLQSLQSINLPIQLISRPWRDADHLPPLSTEVQNKWSYNYAPPLRYAFILSTGAILRFYLLRIRCCYGF